MKLSCGIWQLETSHYQNTNADGNSLYETTKLPTPRLLALGSFYIHKMYVKMKRTDYSTGEAMFANGYVYGLFLLITAFLLSESANTKDLGLAFFLFLLGIISCALQFFKGLPFLKDIYRRYF